MPIDARIPLSAEFGGLNQARQLAQQNALANLQLQTGQSQLSQMNSLAPIEQELRRQQAEQLKAKASTDNQEMILKKAGIAGSLAGVLRGIEDIETRKVVFNSIDPALRQELDVTEDQVLNNDYLDSAVQLSEQIKQQARGTAGNKQLGRTVLANIDGQNQLVSSVFDPVTGTVVSAGAPVPGRIIDASYGETPQQKQEREILTAGGSKAAQEVSSAKVNFAVTGLEAADRLPSLKTAADLLDEVETGGFEGVKLKAKSLFGIEAENEGLLSNLLAKEVMKQIKPVFGGNPAVAESQSLQKIETSIGRNTATNKALIKQMISLSIRHANRGVQAARNVGDDFTAEQIESLLSDFDSGASAKPSQSPDTKRIRIDVNGNIIQ